MSIELHKPELLLGVVGVCRSKEKAEQKNCDHSG